MSGEPTRIQKLEGDVAELKTQVRRLKDFIEQIRRHLVIDLEEPDEGSYDKW